MRAAEENSINKHKDLQVTLSLMHTSKVKEVKKKKDSKCVHPKRLAAVYAGPAVGSVSYKYVWNVALMSEGLTLDTRCSSCYNQSVL